MLDSINLIEEENKLIIEFLCKAGLTNEQAEESLKKDVTRSFILGVAKAMKEIDEKESSKSIT
jgi:hypothetical protein